MSDPQPTPRPLPRWLQILVLVLTALGGGAIGHVPLRAIAPQGPILNPNWNVSAWFIDPANSVSGACASDSNNGTSATCGSAGSGVGPLLTWHELNDRRWGCLGSPRGCPRLTDGSTHTVTFLSSHSNNSDPVVLYNTLENSSSLVLKGGLLTAAIPSSAFTSIGANWSSSCAIANVRDTGQTIGVIGDLLIDTGSDGTATTSLMWCTEGSTTHICRTTIPMTQVTAPPSSLQTPALWTTASGGANGGSGLGNTDAYALYPGFVSVNVVDVQPIAIDYSGSTPTNGDFLYRLNVFDPAGAGKDSISWGPGVVGYEMSADRIINLVGNSSTKDDGCVNCKVNGGLTGGRLATGKYWHLLGGTITSNVSTCNVTGLGVALDGYTEIFANCSFFQGVSIGLVDTYPQVAITITTAGYSEANAISPGYGSVQNGEGFCLQGNTLNVKSGTFAFDSAHSGCAGLFPNTSTQIFNVNGLTTGTSISGSPDVLTPGITINCTNVDTAASTTSFGSYVIGAGLSTFFRKL